MLILEVIAMSEVQTTLNPGDPAPAFSLTSDDGKVVHLADFAGKTIVLYFYPKADTPGCTQQACAIRDIHPDLQGAGIVVIGISPDPPERLRAFREKHALPFVLLSDPDHHVAQLYGAWGEKKLYGRSFTGILRSHVAVDPSGKIIEHKLKVRPATTAELAMKLANPGT
ncbi:thioredoxin-dependent thiol peroxidase [Candidatus Bipolaricaulota bacterium]|nr:thioredoxin-dependent thiol peroxidase [Candidatus Bipolaricaulota bacterium]